MTARHIIGIQLAALTSNHVTEACHIAPYVTGPDRIEQLEIAQSACADILERVANALMVERRALGENAKVTGETK